MASVAVNTPAFVTLNGAEPNVPCPNHKPSSPSTVKMSVEDPIVILLPEGSISKSVAVIVFELIVNPPIAPAVAVIVPAIVTAPAAVK